MRRLSCPSVSSNGAERASDVRTIQFSLHKNEGYLYLFVSGGGEGGGKVYPQKIRQIKDHSESQGGGV
jgi:hypothetical protein